MKRSKIVLGMTTGILAVAALMAAKASRFARNPLAYYSLNHGTCTYSSGLTIYFTKPDGAEATADGHFLYSFNTGHCTHRLYSQNAN